jgi:hypothetical protein
MSVRFEIGYGIGIVHVGLGIQLPPKLGQLLQKLVIVVHRPTLRIFRSVLDIETGAAAIAAVILVEGSLSSEGGDKSTTKEEGCWELHCDGIRYWVCVPPSGDFICCDCHIGPVHLSPIPQLEMQFKFVRRKINLFEYASVQKESNGMGSRGRETNWPV